MQRTMKVKTVNVCSLLEKSVVESERVQLRSLAMHTGMCQMSDFLSMLISGRFGPKLCNLFTLWLVALDDEILIHILNHEDMETIRSMKRNSINTQEAHAEKDCQTVASSSTSQASEEVETALHVAAANIFPLDKLPAAHLDDLHQFAAQSIKVSPPTYHFMLFFGQRVIDVRSCCEEIGYRSRLASEQRLEEEKAECQRAALERERKLEEEAAERKRKLEEEAAAHARAALERKRKREEEDAELERRMVELRREALKSGVNPTNEADFREFLAARRPPVVYAASALEYVEGGHGREWVAQVYAALRGLSYGRRHAAEYALQLCAVPAAKGGDGGSTLVSIDQRPPVCVLAAAPAKVRSAAAWLKSRRVGGPGPGRVVALDIEASFSPPSPGSQDAQRVVHAVAWVVRDADGAFVDAPHLLVRPTESEAALLLRDPARVGFKGKFDLETLQRRGLPLEEIVARLEAALDPPTHTVSTLVGYALHNDLKWLGEARGALRVPGNVRVFDAMLVGPRDGQGRWLRREQMLQHFDLKGFGRAHTAPSDALDALALFDALPRRPSSCACPGDACAAAAVPVDLRALHDATCPLHHVLRV